jgi:hypothetical protein
MKRQRPVNSCLPCRKRRVRCDKARMCAGELSGTWVDWLPQVHPACDRCTSARLDCSYDTSAVIASAGNPSAIHGYSRLEAPGSPFVSASGEPASRVPGKCCLRFRPKISLTLNFRTDSSIRERGQVFAQPGGRSSYVGSTFWGNAIPPEV